MSFRTRLTSFFAVIVVIPMVAVAILVFQLIDSSQSGKADARASGVAAAAAGVYRHASVEASLQARALARELAFTSRSSLPRRAAALASSGGVARLIVSIGDQTVVDTGNRSSIAPGIATVTTIGGRPTRTVEVSDLTAAEFAQELSDSAVAVIVRSGGSTLGSTLSGAEQRSLPSTRGSIKVGSATYRVITERFTGFQNATLTVSVLSDVAGSSIAADRALAAAFIAGFMLLAFFFSILSSRALQRQLGRFLDAARRLASGDFSSSIPTTGGDEFALLGQEFNNMSRQLERRLDELARERARVRKSIRRIGEAFASGLDREALLELALRTSMDATGSDRGRIRVRAGASEPLAEALHLGRLDELGVGIFEAERLALDGDGIGQATADEVRIATVALGPLSLDGPPHGLITVCRERRDFSEDDLELLRTLANQATLAMANVSMHFDIRRQAVTDDLTGLATHGRFQDLLSAEMDEVRRYHYPVGLLMLDIDDFKAVNDLHGHQQGDLVLRRVAETLRTSSRDVDVVARYGGEELAAILPHTDLDGAFELGERARIAIEGLEIARIDGQDALHVTVSVGAAVCVDGDKNRLIAAADAALYVAKREGKNRTVRAAQDTATVGGGE